MQRLQQLSFIVCVLALSWFAMMAVHELGHVLGAVLTGGQVERVVLHPLAISRTDVSPNPSPAVVVWFGPLVGCLVPAAGCLLIPRRIAIARNVASFFAGFCLIANGAYISVDSLDRVGDCGEMIRSGSPFWTLPAFGAVTIPLGAFLWHRLGSPRQFLSDPTIIPPRFAWSALLILLLVVAGECAFSPR
jgi:hypothetical protein